MRAVRLQGSAGSTVPVVEDVPEPAAPARTQLLLRVEASSINGTDLGMFGPGLTAAVIRRAGEPGFDVAGEVLACGPEVTAFSPGDQVMALLGHSGGGQAERVLVGQDQAARVPVSCSPVDAAALPLAGLTALQALYGRAALRSRESPRVLVVGASGGIGSHAVQLARLAGAHVTGAARGSALDFVTGLGADDVVDRRKRPLTALGRRWDVVLDTSARLSFREAGGLVEPGGVFVTTRGVGPDVRHELVPRALRGHRPAFAAVRTRPRSADLAHLAALVDTGRLRTVVSGVYGLDRIAEAYRHADGGVTGKVVVTTAAAPPG